MAPLSGWNQKTNVDLKLACQNSATVPVVRTAELNWLAIQAAPVQVQRGTASLDSWTTGTECKTIFFQHVSLVSVFKSEFLQNSF